MKDEIEQITDWQETNGYSDRQTDRRSDKLTDTDRQMALIDKTERQKDRGRKGRKIESRCMYC